AAQPARPDKQLPADLPERPAHDDSRSEDRSQPELELEALVLLVVYPHGFAVLADLRQLRGVSRYHLAGARHVYPFPRRAFELRQHAEPDVAAAPGRGVPGKRFL